MFMANPGAVNVDVVVDVIVDDNVAADADAI
jgi:hypothetical protein